MGVYMLVYLSVVYLNLYLLIPRLLLKSRFIQYGLILLGIAFLLSVGDICAEAYIHKYYQIPFGQYSFYASEHSHVLEFISGLFLFTIYLISITLTVLYKHWLLTTQKVEQLKAKQLQTELDSFKTRISADFLFGKLRKAAELCKTNPSKSSQVLLQLSRILRYQLYDCSRETVLLSSEIKIMNNYMNLEKLCNDRFDFEITFPQKTTMHFVQPLLFMPFIEDSIKRLSEQENDVRLNIDFSLVDNILTFKCTDNRNISTVIFQNEL
ncbi:histidine kinase [Porphyromonas macacae]|uniref:histidine kinase n=1 Tax=Porphyromonas macacae TaxID=28115 RepID=UPI0024AD1404|nr:histidine kinase [Porphyromonas macacae]